jgi:HD-like signal output (HDOD) protein
MGHKGDIENRYTTDKWNFPENIVEVTREAYARSRSPSYKPRKMVESIEEKRRQSFRK